MGKRQNRAKKNAYSRFSADQTSSENSSTMSKEFQQLTTTNTVQSQTRCTESQTPEGLDNSEMQSAPSINSQSPTRYNTQSLTHNDNQPSRNNIHPSSMSPLIDSQSSTVNIGNNIQPPIQQISRKQYTKMTSKRTSNRLRQTEIELKKTKRELADMQKKLVELSDQSKYSSPTTSVPAHFPPPIYYPQYNMPMMYPSTPVGWPPMSSIPPSNYGPPTIFGSQNHGYFPYNYQNYK